MPAEVARTRSVASAIAAVLRRVARAARWPVALASVPALFAPAACAPCDGVVGCTESPRLSLSGEFVNRDDVAAPPVGGVRVDVISRSPDVLVDSVATATSDASGWWSVSLRARGVQYATVDVVVTPPAPDQPYRVSGLALPTRAVRGGGSQVGRWVPRPYISYVGRVLDAATGMPVAQAQLRVVRRGGIVVTPTSEADTALRTDNSGVFLYDAKPSALAPLYVDFVVDRPGLPRATIANVVVMPGYEYGPPHTYAATTFLLDSAGRASSPAARAGR